MSCLKLFQWHKWGKWEDIERGEITKWSSITQRDIVVGNYTLQQRVCGQCGKKQQDMINRFI